MALSCTRTASIAALIALLVASPVTARDNVGNTASLESRLQRIENLLESQSLLDLLHQVQRLQREVQQLRGEVEQQVHGLNEVKRRQRDLYLDIDRRLRQLEAGAVVQPPGPGAGVITSPPLGTSPGAATDTAPVSPPAAGLQVGPTATPDPAAGVVVDPAQTRKEYQKAFNLLKEGRYQRAIDAFAAFLAVYADSEYADNARYWLGEAHYVMRQFKPAIDEFQRLVTNHPNSPKLTHAMLKIGYILHEMGEKEQAKKVLTDLKRRFPGTTAARLAEERLQRMRLEER